MTITIKGALVVEQAGEVVVSLDAQYDFSDLPAEFHQIAISSLRANRVRLMMPSRESFKNMIKRDKEARDRIKQYDLLPWWKKAFVKKPVCG